METIRYNWFPREGEPRQSHERYCFVAPDDVEPDDFVFTDVQREGLVEVFADLAHRAELLDAEFFDVHAIPPGISTASLAEARDEMRRQVREWGPTEARTVAVRRMLDFSTGRPPQ